jgi:hypothetical protein
MEQVFIIIAVLVFWIFKGVAGAGQRRLPGQDPYEDGSFGSGGSIDITGAARQRTEEGQQRAIEALQRWEEKQRLAGGYGGPPRGGSERIPAASRTRAGRPARIASRTTAERKRKQAYADIARMLDPELTARRTSTTRRRFEVDPETEAASAPGAGSEPGSSPGRSESREPAAGPVASEPSAEKPPRRAASRSKEPAASGLAKLERLPLAARAIVYSEILGRPPSLS